MNEQDKTLFDFAESVRRTAFHIAAQAGGNERVATMAGELCSRAAKMKTYAQMRETLNDPARYDLTALPDKALFDE